MIRPTSWLPLAVLAVLVGLTVWLNALVQPGGARASGASRHDPDLIVENFSARKLGLDGRVLYTLAARKMVHFPDDESAHLEEPAFRSFEPRQPPIAVSAPRGRIEKGGDRVWIEGGVRVLRDGDERHEPLEITTDRVLLLPDEGVARAPSDVLLAMPSGRARGEGLVLDNRERTMKLDRVRATFKPPARVRRESP